MILNEFQRAILREYEGGEFEYLLGLPDDKVAAYFSGGVNLGGTLLLFLLREMDDAEDKADALRMLMTARSQVSEMIQEIENLDLDDNEGEDDD